MRAEVCLAIVAAGVASAAAPPIGADDVHDLILLHPKRPYRVRLHLRVAGQSFKAGWNRQVARLFAYLDQNGDGKLDAAEAGRAPSGEQWRQLSGSQEAIDADAAPPFAELARGKVFCTHGDLLSYYAASTAGPLQTRWGWRPRVGDPLADALWNKLDANRDGKLSRAELLDARRIVSPLDLDDDELVSPTELMPSLGYQQPAVGATGTPHGLALGGLPFLSALPGAPDTVINRLLEQRYGRPVRPGIDLSLEVPLDAPTTPVRKLAGPTDGLRLLSFLTGDSLLLDGWIIEFVRPLPLSQRGVARKKDALATFRLIDSDANGYLTNAEVFTPPFTFVSWLRLADRDGDGKITAQEFTDFWDLKDAIQGVVTYIDVEDQGKSLFRLLDQNGDGRLGLRELNQAWERLREFDQGKGEFTKGGLPSLYRLTIGHGAMPSSLADGAPVRGSVLPSRGPLWFRKMDRNGDGDVSLKEWLGSREQFDKLDANHDGLISLGEAVRAGRR